MSARPCHMAGVIAFLRSGRPSVTVATSPSIASRNPPGLVSTWLSGMPYPLARPLVAPPRLRSATPDSASIRWMNPYDLPVDAARARILCPALYRMCRSEASLVRSAPVTLVPFLRVSVTPSSRRTEAAADCRLLHSVSAMITQEGRDRLPTRLQKIVTIGGHRRADPCGRDGTARTRDLGERDQVSQVRAPQVLDTIGQQQDDLGTERIHSAFVLGDQNNRTGEAAQRGQYLRPAARIEVVGRLVEQQHVGS